MRHLPDPTRTGPAPYAAAVAILGLVIGGCSAPGKPDHSDSERLVWEMPAGWVVAQRRESAGAVLTQLVPAGQQLSTAQDMINIAVLLNGSGLTPEEYARVAPGMLAKSCPGLLGRVISNGQEGEFAWAIWTHSCPNNPASGTVEIAYSKVIGGQKRFYVVDRTWRYQPADSDVVHWTGFLQSIYICDSDRQRPPCPASEATTGGAR